MTTSLQSDGYDFSLLLGKQEISLFTRALSLIVYNSMGQKTDMEMKGLLVGSQQMYLSSMKKTPDYTRMS